MQPGARAGAQEQIGPRPRFQHIGEILGPHFTVRTVIDPLCASDFAGHKGGKLGFRRVIDGRRIADLIIDAHLDPIGRRMAFDDLVEPALHHLAHLGREGADRGAEPSLFRNDVRG